MPRSGRRRNETSIAVATILSLSSRWLVSASTRSQAMNQGGVGLSTGATAREGDGIIIQSEMIPLRVVISL
jgi:hypothetical protein